MHTALQEVREDVLAMAPERFERRLAQETAALRVELLRWSFLFWLGQIAAMGGMFTLMKRSLG